MVLCDITGSEHVRPCKAACLLPTAPPSPTQTELDTSERSLSKRKPQADSRINWRPHIGGAGIVFVASHPIASPPIFEDVTSVFA